MRSLSSAIGGILAAALVIAALGGCGGSSGEADSGESTGTVFERASSLAVMSFNIRFDNPDDGEHAWPNRRERVAELIRFYRPDLLGVQEALSGQMSDLKDDLPEYDWFGRGRQADPEEGEFAAVFYRPGRLELLEDGTFWLSPTPDEPASVGWDAALPRIVTWGRLRDRRTGRTFYHFNTHFDHQGDTARARSAELMARRVGDREQDLPAVVTGDFNFTPDEQPYETLSSVLQDAATSAEQGHFGMEGTSPSGFEVSDAALPRIDYVWTTSDVRVIRSATLSHHFQGDYPSDHLPVVAVFELPEGGSN